MYVVETVGGDINDSIGALPPDLQAAFAELRAALELSPWTVGTPLVPSNPTGLRLATIGASSTGMVIYHVLERDRRVAIVQVSFI